MSRQDVLLDTFGVACCAPLAQAALNPQHAAEHAARFKALGDPIRLRLMSMIASAPGGEMCVCDLTDEFDVSGPTISHHLKVLREAGLIDGERRGTWVYYRPITHNLRQLAGLLDAAPAPLALDHAR